MILKRTITVCLIALLIILVLIWIIVFISKDDVDRIEREEQAFKTIHSDRYDSLGQLIDSLRSIEGSYCATFSEGSVTIDDAATTGGIPEASKAQISTLTDKVNELFGEEMLLIEKETDGGSAVIIFTKTIDVSRIPFHHSWVSVSMWYCDEEASPIIKKQVQLHGEHFEWLDQHYAILTVGKV